VITRMINPLFHPQLKIYSMFHWM